jgi:saccharopine dehydrogenase (NAD+, L-lysine-forming)
MQKKVLILGGYGNARFLIARLLLQETDVQLVIAGRNLGRAQRAADQLNHEFHTDRASSIQADATDTKSLETAFKGATIVVVASSTIDYAHNVYYLAIEAGADCLDIQLSSLAKSAVLGSLREKIESNGRCFIFNAMQNIGMLPSTT